MEGEGDLVTYVCWSSDKKVTNKVALNGYAYTKRGGKGEVSYWYCDQRKICSASLIEKKGAFSYTVVDKINGRSSNRGWGADRKHESHPPDHERIHKEISTRTKRLEKRRKAQEKRATSKSSPCHQIETNDVDVELPTSEEKIHRSFNDASNYSEIAVEKDDAINDLKIESIWGCDVLADTASASNTVSELDDSTPSDTPPTPVLIDTDGGFYDAWALALALTKDTLKSGKRYKVVGITTVNGCTTVDNAVQNTGRVLRAIGGDAGNSPVFKGTDSPLVGTKTSTPRPAFFGTDGFGNTLSPLPTEKQQRVVNEHGVTAIIKLAEKYKGQLTIIALGPLTNLAIAVKLHPNIKNYIKEIFILGGNSEGIGNVTVCSEFNFYADPEAAQVVLENFSACPLYLLPWETCMRSASSQYAFRTQTLGSINTPLTSLLNKIESKNLHKHGDHWVAPDAVAVACFLNHKVMRKTEHYHCSVELQGKHTRGMMVVDKNFVKQKQANVLIITEVDRQIYEKMLIEAMEGSYGKVSTGNDPTMNINQYYF